MSKNDDLIKIFMHFNAKIAMIIHSEPNFFRNFAP